MAHSDHPSKYIISDKVDYTKGVRENSLHFWLCDISTSLRGTKISFPRFITHGYDDVLLINYTNKIIRIRYRTRDGVKYVFDILPGETHIHHTGDFIINNSVSLRSVNGTPTGCVDLYFNYDTTQPTTTTTTTTSTSTSTSTTSSTTTTSTTFKVYDTDLTFVTSTYAFEEGVSAQALAVNQLLKLEFDKILNPLGLYSTMTISVATAPVLQVNYRTDYFGQPFRFIHTNGMVYSGTFNNDINF